MGAIGIGAFDNEVAADWLAMASMSCVAGLIRVLQPLPFPTADSPKPTPERGAVAIAAAEIVAIALGHGRKDVPEDARRVADALAAEIKETPGIATLAGQAALAAVIPGSRYRRFWQAVEADRRFHDGMQDLHARLAAAAAQQGDEPEGWVFQPLSWMKEDVAHA